jgi:hypothetical protein
MWRQFYSCCQLGRNCQLLQLFCWDGPVWLRFPGGWDACAGSWPWHYAGSRECHLQVMPGMSSAAGVLCVCSRDTWMRVTGHLAQCCFMLPHAAGICMHAGVFCQHLTHVLWAATGLLQVHLGAGTRAAACSWYRARTVLVLLHETTLCCRKAALSGS